MKRALPLLALLLVSGRAAAFCRTTTCDPQDPKQACEFDSDGCVVTGKKLAWRSSCVTVAVQELGSPKNHLDYDTVANVVEHAFGAWMDADCGGKGPSIDVKLIGAVQCDVSEYNGNRANANIVLFREDEWPYIGASNAVGLTTTRFDTKTGELWDADIELNGVGSVLTVGDPIRGDDLLSVLTHEAGHFLGLSHTLDPEATMRAIYDPGQDADSFRSIEADDVEGICAVYPPNRKAATNSCTNRHGFSEQCGADQPAPPPEDSKGCSISAPPRSSSSGQALLLAGLVAACLARRRSIV